MLLQVTFYRIVTEKKKDVYTFAPTQKEILSDAEKNVMGCFPSYSSEFLGRQKADIYC